MSRYYLDFPELVQAKKADLLKLKEDKIDTLLLEIQKSNYQHQTSFSDYKNEAISNKSIFGYIQKSAKSLISQMSSLKTKKSDSPDDAKLSIIIEQNKILASLIVKIGRNQNQLNEIIGDAE